MIRKYAINAQGDRKTVYEVVDGNDVMWFTEGEVKIARQQLEIARQQMESARRRKATHREVG